MFQRHHTVHDKSSAGFHIFLSRMDDHDDTITMTLMTAYRHERWRRRLRRLRQAALIGLRRDLAKRKDTHATHRHYRNILNYNDIKHDIAITSPAGQVAGSSGAANTAAAAGRYRQKLMLILITTHERSVHPKCVGSACVWIDRG